MKSDDEQQIIERGRVARVFVAPVGAPTPDNDVPFGGPWPEPWSNTAAPSSVAERARELGFETDPRSPFSADEQARHWFAQGKTAPVRTISEAIYTEVASTIRDLGDELAERYPHEPEGAMPVGLGDSGYGYGDDGPKDDLEGWRSYDSDRRKPKPLSKREQNAKRKQRQASQRRNRR